MNRIKIKVKCQKKLYCWYRFTQLLMWNVFRPDDAYDLYVYISEEMKLKPEKYLRIRIES